MSENFALTTMQAANELHVSIGTLLRWVHEGRIPACKIGDRKYLFSRKVLENIFSRTVESATGGRGRGELTKQKRTIQKWKHIIVIYYPKS